MARNDTDKHTSRTDLCSVFAHICVWGDGNVCARRAAAAAVVVAVAEGGDVK